MKEKNKTSKGIVSFVLGILSVFGALFWYITLPTGILAVILGAISANKERSKLGKTGLILGIIGLALFAFIYFGMILLMLVAY